MKVKEFVDAGGVVNIYTTWTTIGLPLEKSFVKIPTRYLFSSDPSEIEILEYYLDTLYELLVKRSPEEIAAEESVAKAKDALKAAEETLNKIKEKK